MTDKNVWFVTGAGRGMGVDIVKAALAAGHAVVATGRNADSVARALGDAADLLVATLDVTHPADAKAAVNSTLRRFGRIDVLVNNAGIFYAGTLPRRLPGTGRDQPVRPGERHPCRASRDACAAPRTRRDDLLNRGHFRAGVRLCLCRGEIRR
jgi:NAD(P)-dependent dehydrogenase (short-subunit alcohol dehydrogenase family)